MGKKIWDSVDAINARREAEDKRRKREQQNPPKSKVIWIVAAVVLAVVLVRAVATEPAETRPENLILPPAISEPGVIRLTPRSPKPDPTPSPSPNLAESSPEPGCEAGMQLYRDDSNGLFGGRTYLQEVRPKLVGTKLEDEYRQLSHLWATNGSSAKWIVTLESIKRTCR